MHRGRIRHLCRVQVSAGASHEKEKVILSNRQEVLPEYRNLAFTEHTARQGSTGTSEGEAEHTP